MGNSVFSAEKENQYFSLLSSDSPYVFVVVIDWYPLFQHD